MKYILFLLSLVVLGLFFATQKISSPVSAGIGFSNGQYTNLCGTGTAATADTCNKGCTTSGGYCFSSQANVVKYTCSGRVTECRSNESGFATSHTLSGTPCGTTIQIDVFTKQCRVNGGWTCGDADLLDYMVWYSGDCQAATATPTSTPAPTASPTPSATPKPTHTPTPTPTQVLGTTHQASCDALDISEGNNVIVPANVLLRARASDNLGSIRTYRFFFGDGKQEDAGSPEIRHRYESSGTFRARVDVQDSQGIWRTSSQCETTVTVKSLPIESHKSGCSDVHFIEGNNTKAPTTAKFVITGFDNKGSIKRFKMDFGNGITAESDSPNFEQRYDTAGTYTIRGYVLDSGDNWKGGDGSCKRSLYVNTEPLSSQPKTGTPTVFSLLGISSGAVGFAILKLRKTLGA